MSGRNVRVVTNILPGAEAFYVDARTARSEMGRIKPSLPVVTFRKGRDHDISHEHRKPRASAQAASRARSPLARRYRAGISDRFRPRLRYFVPVAVIPAIVGVLWSWPFGARTGACSGSFWVIRQQSPLLLIPFLALLTDPWVDLAS